ncbi:S16 family serine protease [Fredinandcohnia sp. 179-A 10B2 NHS]|uniref:S16 family serine protease n=1 Tax=Fredinandcohnia sp. 179-A 10B2 NHS TaxID=3235176 RepID=UPI0039A24399
MKSRRGSSNEIKELFNYNEMKEEKMNLRINRRLFIFLLATILAFVGWWYTYFANFINSFTYVGGIFLSFFILFVLLLVFRNARDKLKYISILTIITGVLLCYELGLLKYESTTYTASFHASPIELDENSGIHLMVVRTVEILILEDEESIRNNYEQQQLIDLYRLDNEDRYISKNLEIFGYLGFFKDEFEQMGENVTEYLGSEPHMLAEFLNREDLAGDSAGLGLALTSLIEQQEVINNKEIAVTGALSGNGDVLPIGMVKEKMIIAEEQALPYIIIPIGNAKEAAATKEEYQLSIEVFSVPHIDDAIKIIGELNKF